MFPNYEEGFGCGITNNHFSIRDKEVELLFHDCSGNQNKVYLANWHIDHGYTGVGTLSGKLATSLMIPVAMSESKDESAHSNQVATIYEQGNTDTFIH